MRKTQDKKTAREIKMLLKKKTTTGKNKTKRFLTVQQIRNKTSKTGESHLLSFVVICLHFYCLRAEQLTPVSHRFTSVPQRCHIYTLKHEWNRTCADFHRRSDLVVLEAVAGSPQQPCLPHSSQGRTHLFTLPASSASTHVGWDRPPPKKKSGPVVNGGAPPCGHHYCWCSCASKEPKMLEYNLEEETSHSRVAGHVAVHV